MSLLVRVREMMMVNGSKNKKEHQNPDPESLKSRVKQKEYQSQDEIKVFT
jgi:hypothetical protein